MAFATDEEIRYAEQLLLQTGKTFSEDRRAIIKSDVSGTFHACPGSGKTTVLLAKLVILANRMPLGEGKGVCVLTHTNVAIDEIKARLGNKANILFTYPNFFGTFQTFVHKYFTEQALDHYYHTSISYVDDVYARNAMLRLVNRDKECMGMLRALFGHSGQNNFYDYLITIVQNLRVDWDNRKLVVNKRPLGFDTKTGSALLRAKEQLLQDGILTFGDAYDLALRYIRDNISSVNKIIANRFAYLFIDEMQDVRANQHELVSQLFTNDAIMRQYFGDQDQAIFDNEETEIDTLFTTESFDLSIDNSCRFGQNIANVLRMVCPRNYHQLSGDAAIQSQRPKMIVFTDARSVLPKYVQLLQELPFEEGVSIAEYAQRLRKDDPLHRLNIKAIGMCGVHSKEDIGDNIEIKSYFPPYKRKQRVGASCPMHLSDYLTCRDKGNVKEVRSNLMKAILEALDVCKIKTDKNRKHTTTTLLKTLRDMEPNLGIELKSKIAGWMLGMINNQKQEVMQDIRVYIKDMLEFYFGITSTDATLQQYLYAEDMIPEEERLVSDVYHDEQSGIDVEVATVHSVKGETHVATLYLETSYYNKTESEKLKQVLEGEYQDKRDKYAKQQSYVMYVGMSRPKYVLCYAIRKDHYEALDAKMVNAYWDVIEIE